MPYLLPCRCGHKLAIQRSQAGSYVQCTACGNRVDVPTLGGLSKLETTSETVTDSKQSRSARYWNPLRGFIAAVFLVVAMIGLFRAGMFAAIRLANPTHFTAEDMLTAYDEVVATMPAADVWDTWCYIQDRGLTEKSPPSAFVIKWKLEALDPAIAGWGITGLVGLVGLLVTTLSRRKTV